MSGLQEAEKHLMIFLLNMTHAPLVNIGRLTLLAVYVMRRNILLVIWMLIP
jgi:hypothetical protein